MIDKKEINLEKAMAGSMYLEDGGFGKELTKLKTMGELINYAGTDGGVVFQMQEVRAGISYILDDIAREIEEGLDYVSKEIIEKMRPAEARSEENERKTKVWGREGQEEPLPPGMHPVKTF